MSEEPTTSDLVELVRKQFEALNRGDLDGVMSSVAEDGVLDGRAIFDLVEGRAAIRGFLDEWFRAFTKNWITSLRRSVTSAVELCLRS